MNEIDSSKYMECSEVNYFEHMHGKQINVLLHKQQIYQPSLLYNRLAKQDI